MIHAQNVKRQQVTAPQAIVDNAAFATATIDTVGFRYLVVCVMLGALDIAVAAMKLQESEDSGMSGAADIPGAIFGTSTNTAGSTSTLPAATDDNKLYTFYVDLRGRMRYIDLVLTGGDGSTGTFACAWAELSRAEELPTTAVLRGAGQELMIGQ